MHELTLGWRSRARIAAGVGVTFATGVLAATPGAPWWLRFAALAVFVAGAYACLDAVVFTSSWRLTATALKVPTLRSRKREISGRDDLVVGLEDGWWSRLTVTGPNGTRAERVNPLVSGRDLRRWWDALPG